VHDDAAEAKEPGLGNPYYTASYDFTPASAG